MLSGGPNHFHGSFVYMMNSGILIDGILIFVGISRLYKNQLQTFAQKRSLPLPIYSSEHQGPVHARRFKCKVTIDGRTYESREYFTTLKDAEHAAAKAALMSLSAEGVNEASVYV